MNSRNNLKISRLIATILVVTSSMSISCSSWRLTRVTDITQVEAESLEGKQVKFYSKDGNTVEMRVSQVDFPTVRGSSRQEAEVNLYDFATIGVRHVSVWRTSLLVVGTGAFVRTLASGISPPLTRTLVVMVLCGSIYQMKV